MNLLRTDAYHYELPQELIAQEPLKERECARLMVVDKKSGEIRHHTIADLPGFISENSQLIVNDTKVIPARLIGMRPSGGGVELLLLRAFAEGVWEVLARPSKKLEVGMKLQFGEDFTAVLEEKGKEGHWKAHFQTTCPFYEALDRYGVMPLPPYIARKRGEEEAIKDKKDYQTIFAKIEGAVAAPTAGFHFTPHLMQKLESKGVEKIALTLHVGLGTFRPVQTEFVTDHEMHAETVCITEEAAKRLNTKKSEQQRICIGTTSCRALEATADEEGKIQSGRFETDIFIYPGYHFRATTSLLTNFHLPGSTLLMLVSALGGYELIREAYAKAIEERYRFYSYGDAMLIL